MTASVSELMNSGEASAPYCSTNNPWISHAVTSGVHLDDFVIKPGEAAGALGSRGRGEAYVAAPWNLHSQGGGVDEHRLASITVALVGHVLQAFLP